VFSPLDELSYVSTHVPVLVNAER